MDDSGFSVYGVLSYLTLEQSTNLKDSHHGCSVHHAEEACHSPLEVSGRVPPFVTEPHTLLRARKMEAPCFFFVDTKIFLLFCLVCRRVMLQQNSLSFTY